MNTRFGRLLSYENVLEKPQTLKLTIELTTDLTRIDRAKLLEFLKATSWQSEIGAENLDCALENSICMAAIAEDELVGFVRAVTDQATFCWIDDLFVDPEYRGQGIARRLMDAIVSHERLVAVATWFLCSSNPEARKIFAELGFHSLPDDRAAKIMGLPRVINDKYRV